MLRCTKFWEAEGRIAFCIIASTLMSFNFHSFTKSVGNVNAYGLWCLMAKFFRTLLCDLDSKNNEIYLQADEQIRNRIRVHRWKGKCLRPTFDDYIDYYLYTTKCRPENKYWRFFHFLQVIIAVTGLHVGSFLVLFQTRSRSVCFSSPNAFVIIREQKSSVLETEFVMKYLAFFIASVILGASSGSGSGNNQ